MLESDKGKHVLLIGKLPPRSERIISWGRKHTSLLKHLRWGGKTDELPLHTLFSQED